MYNSIRQFAVSCDSPTAWTLKGDGDCCDEDQFGKFASSLLISGESSRPAAGPGPFVPGLTRLPAATLLLLVLEVDLGNYRMDNTTLLLGSTTPRPRPVWRKWWWVDLSCRCSGLQKYT